MKYLAYFARGIVPTKPKLPARRGLTDRQRSLVKFYWTSAAFNQRAAAVMAGYPKSALLNIYQEFRKPAVVAEMKRRAARAERKFEVTYEKLIEELAKVAFFNMSDVMEFDEETGQFTAISLDAASVDTLAALGEVKIDTVIETDKDTGDKYPIQRISVKPYNKLDAIDKLMRHAGMSKEVVKHHHEHSLADRLRSGRTRMNKQLERAPLDGEFEKVDADE